MKFIAPERLYLMVALLPVAAALVYAARRRKRELDRLFSDPGAAKAATRLSRGGRAARIALLFVALLAAAVAAARPYWKTRGRKVEDRGRDVAVVFDVSKSMWARDLPPSRLEHAKYLLRQFAENATGDRLALIAFAGNAYTACPLTADRAVFREYVDELSPESVQLGGTDLERALREALRCLEGAPGTPAIVVLTDGDELTGQSSRVLAELRKRKIPLVVIGLGDPEKPAQLPDAEGSLRRDRNGKILTSKLNEPALRRLAAATGGAYIRSTAADPGAPAAAARIAQLAPAGRGERSRELPEERFDLFVALAAVALALALAIPERPWRKGAVLLAACAALATANAAEPAETKDAEVAAAKTAAELYNLGLKRHEAGDDAGGARCFEAVLGHADRDERVRAKALFNLGALEHGKAQKEFQEALGELERQQLDPAAKRTDAAVERLAAAREFYAQALAGGGAVDAAADNLRLYERDLDRLKKLKSEIEELKKQRQKAQQSTRNAQKQNQKQQQKQQQGDKQQDQQQQGQQSQQQKQQQGDKKQDRQQQGQQKQQGDKQQQQSQQKQQQGDKQQNAARDAARQAAEESDKLREQAKKLGQKELEEKARRAAEELRQAEKAPDPQSARPHLDKAAKELGANEDEKPAEDKKPGENKKSGENKKTGEGQRPEERQLSPDELKQGREGLLRTLDGEEREQRRMLHRRMRRPPVERDW